MASHKEAITSSDEEDIKFMDADEESDEEEIKIDQNKFQKKNTIQTKLPENLTIMDFITVKIDQYPFRPWNDFFPDKKVSLKSMFFNPAWSDFLNIIEKKDYVRGIERILSDCIGKKNETVVPYPELVFNALTILSPHRIKVVIIGQDPYINMMEVGAKYIPQAMGLSFSVPYGYPKPPSLENIYKNLLYFEHIKEIPTGGCLIPWVLQGCFMINSALTTFHGKSNAHKNVWKDFTHDLLKYLNDTLENLVFVVWGKDAHNMCLGIDPYKHCIITSSHPSNLGFEKTFSGITYGNKKIKDAKSVTYPAFKTIDHFGKINSYLESVGKSTIYWDLIE